LSVSSSGDGRGHVPAVRTSFELLDKSLRHAALEDGRLMGLLHAANIGYLYRNRQSIGLDENVHWSKPDIVEWSYTCCEP
jgi:hypothetical protein